MPVIAVLVTRAVDQSLKLVELNKFVLDSSISNPRQSRIVTEAVVVGM
jgi:hypothetical protein